MTNLSQRCPLRWALSESATDVELSASDDNMNMLYTAFVGFDGPRRLALNYEKMLAEIADGLGGCTSYMLEFLQYYLVDKSTLGIIDPLSADENNQVDEYLYSLQSILNFVPLVQHAKDTVNLPKRRVKITFDGDEYKLYVDGDLYTNSYGTFDEFSELVRSDKLPKPQKS